MSLFLSLMSATTAMQEGAVVETNLIEVEMTSLEIAGLTGKAHRNVLRDIDVLKLELESRSSDLSHEFSDGVYVNRGREYRMVNMTSRAANNLVLGYDPIHRDAVVQELQRKTEALRVIRDEVETVEEAREVAIEALSIRTNLRDRQHEFSSIIGKAFEDGTIKAPSKGMAISNLNRLNSMVVTGKTPSKIVKESGMSPRDLFVANGDVESLVDYTEAQGAIKVLAKLGMTYQQIKDALSK